MNNLLALLKYWQYGLAAVAVLILSCFISYCVGVSDGRDQERSEQLVTVAKEVIKSSVQREKIEHETRKLSDPAIDRALTTGGWMRPIPDR